MAIQSSSAQSRGLATLIEAGAQRRLADEVAAPKGWGERSGRERSPLSHVLKFSYFGFQRRNLLTVRV